MAGKTSAVVLAGVGALAVGVVVGLLAGRTTRSGHDDGATMARILARLDALEARGTPMAAPLRPASPTEVRLAELRGGLTTGTMTPAMGKQAAALEQARVRALDSGFEQEAADPSSAKAELDMLKVMADPQMAATALVAGNPDVECRRNSCRVTADFRASDDAMEWALNYVTLAGSASVKRAQPVVVTNPDGSARLRLYAVRGRS